MLQPILKAFLRSLPWWVAGLVLLAFLFLLNHQLRHQQTGWEQELERRYQDWIAQTRALEARRLDEARTLTALIAANPQVLRLVTASQNAQTPADLEDLRQTLALELESRWQALHAQGARHLNVYLAPNLEVFFRAHHPGRYGDRDPETSQLALASLESGQIGSQLLLGRYGPAYSAAQPLIAADGSQLGVVELGLWQLKAEGDLPGQGSALLLHPDLGRGWFWRGARTEVVRSTPRNQWRLEAAALDPAPAWAAAGLLPDPATAVGYQRLSWEGREYLLFSQLLKPEFRSGSEAVLALMSWQDLTEDLAIHHTLMGETRVRGGLAIGMTLLALWLMLTISRYFQRQDLEERHQTLQRELAFSEAARQELILALDSSDSGLWAWDIAADKMTLSPQWKSICGITESTRLLPDTEEWVLRVHPNDKSPVHNDLLRHIKGETERFEKEYRLRAEDGSYRWIYSRGKVVERDADGRALRMLGVYTDTSRHKEAEITILRQQAALRALNEIAALSLIDPEEQLRRALTLGAGYLGLSVGIISRVAEGKYHIQVQVSPPAVGLVDGAVYPLADTYGSITLAEGGLVAIDHMGASAHREHACYRVFQLEAYLGVPLVVQGRRHGVLSFAATTPRYHAFDDLDKDFIRVLGRWVEAALERGEVTAIQQELVRRFRKLSDRLPGFLYQYQLYPDGRDCFPYTSPGIATIYGLRPEQVIAGTEKIFEVIHPEDRDWMRASILDSAERLTPWQACFRVNHPSRGLRWIRGDSLPEKLEDESVLWHGFLVDVTDEKLAEQALQVTSSLQSAILDAAGLAIIATDNKGTITLFNRGAEVMLGYSAKELVGKSTPEALHLRQEIEARAVQLSEDSGEHCAPGFGVFASLASRGEVADARGWTYVRKDGSRLPVMLTISAIRDASGAIQGYLCIARDMSLIPGSSTKTDIPGDAHARRLARQ